MNKFALKSDTIKTPLVNPTNGNSYYRTAWMTPKETDAFTPNTYDIEALANSKQESHFHINDEFQLVIKGSGTIESEPLNIGTIVYASRFTAYGPMQSGPDGFSIMAIRMAIEPISNYRSPRESEIIDKIQVKKIIQPIDRGDCSTLTEVEVFKDLIDGEPGALTGIIRIPPDFELNNIQEMFPGDKFIFVKTGSFYIAGIELTQWDHVFLTADEALFQIKTGSTGSELIILQFSQ